LPFAQHPFLVVLGECNLHSYDLVSERSRWPSQVRRAQIYTVHSTSINLCCIPQTRVSRLFPLKPVRGLNLRSGMPLLDFSPGAMEYATPPEHNVRSGVWTSDEEVFAKVTIKYFEQGLLNLRTGGNFFISPPIHSELRTLPQLRSEIILAQSFIVIPCVSVRNLKA
jgi:hypothetical protein